MSRRRSIRIPAIIIAIIRLVSATDPVRLTNPRTPATSLGTTEPALPGSRIEYSALGGLLVLNEPQSQALLPD